MKRIAVAGNIVTDYVKTVNTLPSSGMLAHILTMKRAVGGCVPNVLIDLAKLDPDIPLSAYGRVGDDENGMFQRSVLEANGINIDNVLVTPDVPTSFSDAMCAADTGERTFFHHRGANAVFAPEDVCLDGTDVGLLHVGYPLLLDRFDAPNPEYGTEMAAFLRQMSEMGIITTMDCVSESNDRFRAVIVPSLKYCDYTIMTEVESCAVCGISPRDAGSCLIEENIKRALEAFIGYGVRKCAVIHCPEAGYAMTHDGCFYRVPSLELPPEFVKGSVGAGDAFAAGCLYTIMHGGNETEMLEFASLSAAASLRSEDSVSGMLSADEVAELGKMYPRRSNKA